MLLALDRVVLLALGCLGPSLASTVGNEGGQPAQDGLAPIASSSDPSTGLVGVSGSFLDGFVAQPAIPARPALLGFRRPQTAEIQKRSCLSNGTNFCFSESNNYCLSCGICCSSGGDTGSKWCCPSDGTCCGSSCCASGQTCNEGTCYLPLETVTETSSVSVTSVVAVTDVATVVQIVVVTSTVDSIIVVTETSAATQTNWVYVTSTVISKRAEPTADATTTQDTVTDATADTTVNATAVATGDAVEEAAAPSATPTDVPADDSAAHVELIRPRQEDVAGSESAVQLTTTVSEVITATVLVTSLVSSTTIVLSTSTELESVVHTSTRVLNAKTTVEATSTLTFTSHSPVTLTVTEISTIHATGGGPMTSSTVAPALITGSTDKIARTSLSSGAIAGIAVGAALAVLVACLFLFCILRRHKKRKAELQAITEDYAYFGTGRSNSEGGIGDNSRYVAYPSDSPNQYSGPPPPAARSRATSVQSPSMAQASERGLPPIPWFSEALNKPVATAPTSPTPTTSSSRMSNKEANTGKHVRSPSGQTMATVASSTVVGGGSARTSLQSMTTNSANAKAALLLPGASAGNNPHRRASSSGGGSGMTVETLNELEGDEPTAAPSPATMASGVSVPQDPQHPLQPIPQPAVLLQPTPQAPQAPLELAQPRPQPRASSPEIRTQHGVLGPLRVVNTPAIPDAIDETADPNQQSNPDHNFLTAPILRWAGAGAPRADSETSSVRSSVHPGSNNVITRDGQFFYRDY